MGSESTVWATIDSVSSYLPSRVLGNEELSEEVGWTVDKILEKTGIVERRIAAPEECVSDMASAAAKQLIQEREIDREAVQFLILCTQTPDHLLPSTACIVQECLGLSTRCAAFDINLGCSGYIYALGVANALIRSRMFERGIVLTADTYTKFINPKDRSIRTLFGDAATATWVTASASPGLMNFELGTDGKGKDNFIIPAGGTRLPHSSETARLVEDASGSQRSQDEIFMNGQEILVFSLKRVPPLVRNLLATSGLQQGDIDWFVFHQANKFMLDYLAQKMRVPPERMCFCLRHVGNTVSSTIPLVIEHGVGQGQLAPGDKLLLVGFGVGYSWGGCILNWTGPGNDSEAHG